MELTGARNQMLVTSLIPPRRRSGSAKDSGIYSQPTSQQGALTRDLLLWVLSDQLFFGPSYGLYNRLTFCVVEVCEVCEAKTKATIFFSESPHQSHLELDR